jgi:hypothetical protein
MNAKLRIVLALQVTILAALLTSSYWSTIQADHLAARIQALEVRMIQ